MHPVQRFGFLRLRNSLAHVHRQRLSFGPAVHSHGAGVPRDGAALQVLYGDGVKRVTHHHSQAHQLIGLAQRIAGVHHLRYFNKGNDRTLNHVVQRAVRQDAHGVKLACLRLHGGFFGLQGFKHRLRIGHQAVVIHQVRNNMAHWPTHVAQNEVDDECG